MIVLKWCPLFILILISIFYSGNKEIINPTEYHSLPPCSSEPFSITDADPEPKQNNLSIIPDAKIIFLK